MQRPVHVVVMSQSEVYCTSTTPRNAER
eukprot:COSAG03_NODE_9490_length_715_cov_1.301948_2_plen_27_part_01